MHCLTDPYFGFFFLLCFLFARLFELYACVHYIVTKSWVGPFWNLFPLILVVYILSKLCSIFFGDKKIHEDTFILWFILIQLANVIWYEQDLYILIHSWLYISLCSAFYSILDSFYSGSHGYWKFYFISFVKWPSSTRWSSHPILSSSFG